MTDALEDISVCGGLVPVCGSLIPVCGGLIPYSCVGGQVWHKSLGRVLREKKENHEWWAEKLAYGFGEPTHSCPMPSSHSRPWCTGGIGGLFIAGGAVQCATQEKKDPSGIVLGGVSAAIGGFYWMDLKKSQARTEDWASEY